MAAAGVQECDVVAMIVQQDGGFPIYTVKWDPELFGALLEIAEKFWRDYVVTCKPPPPDGTEASGELLSRLFPRTTIKDVIEATPEQQAVMQRYADARQALKAAEGAKELAEQELLAAIGEHQAIVGTAGRMSMTERAGSPAWKRIAEELGATPGLIEQHRGQSIRYPRWTAAKEK
jgi:predicted phage-related endonuclease